MQLCKCALRLWVLVIGLAMVASATPGSFRGTIVNNPSAAKGWIYVQGRNGSARRVEIAHAKITYDEDVPAADRGSQPEQALKAGAEVRVTAEQGSDGEWHATEVEILKPVNGTQQSSQHRTTTG